jgi:hypothetical protein
MRKLQPPTRKTPMRSRSIPAAELTGVRGGEASTAPVEASNVRVIERHELDGNQGSF